MSRTITRSIRAVPELFAAIDKAAKERGMKQSRFMSETLATAVGFDLPPASRPRAPAKPPSVEAIKRAKALLARAEALGGE